MLIQNPQEMQEEGTRGVPEPGDGAEMLDEASGWEGLMDFLEDNLELLSSPFSSVLAVAGVTRALW